MSHRIPAALAALALLALSCGRTTTQPVPPTALLQPDLIVLPERTAADTMTITLYAFPQCPWALAPTWRWSAQHDVLLVEAAAMRYGACPDGVEITPGPDAIPIAITGVPSRPFLVVVQGATDTTRTTVLGGTPAGILGSRVSVDLRCPGLREALPGEAVELVPSESDSAIARAVSDDSGHAVLDACSTAPALDLRLAMDLFESPVRIGPLVEGCGGSVQVFVMAPPRKRLP